MYCDTSKVIINRVTKSTPGINAIVTKKHYAQKWTASQYIFGLYWDMGESQFFEDKDLKLIGVILYGHPVGRRAVKSIVDTFDTHNVLELKRLWIEDGYGKNIESYVISQSIKILKTLAPTVKVLISYADPSANHKGIIYRATNWLYQGREVGFGDCYKYRFPGQTAWLSSRSMAERCGSAGLVEVKKAFPDIEYTVNLRKHRYLYFLCGKKEKKELIKNLKHPLLKYD